LKEKSVSLAMIYDIHGNILWHKGRPVTGKTVAEGGGFSRSLIQKSFTSDEVLDRNGLIMNSGDGYTTDSISYLHIKSLIIRRVHNGYFLYIDSGIKESFSAPDCESFKVLGELLGNSICWVKESEAGAAGITGTSKLVKNIREQVVTYSMTDEPILLTGEAGTGKNHIAQLIHNCSGRSNKFKLIHTPGIPENLFESEMFGYKEGAFTDART
ncbi:MAG: sigma-54 factor interaction domain-containing protein, partial [bacterium]|nr:sigma-54 factor interaction domain-containing protein [bacterium]